MLYQYYTNIMFRKLDSHLILYVKNDHNLSRAKQEQKYINPAE